jgi:acetylornithine deacetylase/succinyl-diaminopimelate desuccinylase-like protein
MSVSDTELKARVIADRARRHEQLARLVSFPSLAFPGFDPADSAACAEAVADMLREVGFPCVELVDVGGQNPLVWAELPAGRRADGTPAPTLLLYAHYDVQPAPREAQGWRTDPFTLTVGAPQDGRLYGRGAADDKAGIVQHLSALRAFGLVGGLSPLGIKVCFEGEEEYAESLADYIPRDPARFAADAYLVCDGGNLELGKPLLETQLRGVAEVTVRLRTLKGALHSGAFGGPAPDAYLALNRLVASCFDADGNTRIDGVSAGDYTGAADYPESLFRRQIELANPNPDPNPGSDADLPGTGSVASRLWTRPSLNVIGLDMPSVHDSSNIIIPEVTARMSLRFPPGQEAAAVLDALTTHLREHTPWGAELTVLNAATMNAFTAKRVVSPPPALTGGPSPHPDSDSSVDGDQGSAPDDNDPGSTTPTGHMDNDPGSAPVEDDPGSTTPTCPAADDPDGTPNDDGPITTAARAALTAAFDYPCATAGSGGSIPLLHVLQRYQPDAEFLIFGPIDAELSRMHGGNESVDPDELEKCAVAEALLFNSLL